MLNKLFIIFLEESIDKMEDKDVYLLYRDYNKKKAQALIDGKLEDYKHIVQVVDMLKKEVLSRCC